VRAISAVVARTLRREISMLYLVAVVLPPLAVLLCGKPFQALLSVVLSLFLYFPGLIHALFVVNKHYADKRQQQLIAEMRRLDRDR
jgi:uncharacterized membrane protein YqaE (UPF0057 family)